jgi:regulator of sigma E protease
MSIVVKLVLGIGVLGVLIFIHELGHFLAAKACRIRVLAFSIGFGRVLLHKTIGTTDYRISAIPFGGYVNMAGEHPEDERVHAPDEFPSRPIWQRAFVAIAGPAANFISAIFMIWFMFIWGVERPDYFSRPVLGGVADSSAASDIGLAAGDSLVSINGRSISTWDDIETVFLTPELKYDVAVYRDGNQKTFTIIPDQKKKDRYKYPPFGMELPTPSVIGKVMDDMPAAKAGLKSGDTIVSIGGREIAFWSQISEQIQNRPDSSALQIVVARGIGRLTTSMTPKFDEKEKRWLIGIQFSPGTLHTVRYSPAIAWKMCIKKSWDFTTMIFVFLKKMITGEISWKLVSGPLGIIPASGFMVFQGLSNLLYFMGMLSINLAVINVFPLIITDGGMLLFLLLEAVRRKPLSLKAQLAINKVGISLFIVLFILITYNDILRIPEYFKMFLK